MHLTLKEVLFTFLVLSLSSAKDLKVSLSESAEDKREREKVSKKSVREEQLAVHLNSGTKKREVEQKKRG